MPLQLYYNFEQTSGQFPDLSGNGNESTSIAVADRTDTGVLGGNSPRFDGTGDDIQTPEITSGATALTFACWVYIENEDDDDSFISNFNGTALGQPIIETQASTGGLRFGHFDGTNTTDINTNVVASAGQWHHIVGTHDQSTAVLYHNGEEIGSESQSSPSGGTLDLTLAYRNNTDTEFHLDGRLDEVRVYDHALSPQEVSYLYEVAAGQASFTSSKKEL